MDEEKFWQILADASAHVKTNPDWFGKELQAAIEHELVQYSADEIMEFRRRFDEKIDDAYSLELWGAAYLINGGCSDDSFHYFRNWLVGMGPEIYSAAVRHPDSLADVLDGDWPMHATLDGAACPAWMKVTRREHHEFYNEYEKLPRLSTSPVPEEEDWDFDDEEEIVKHFPRLSAIYLNQEYDDVGDGGDEEE